MINKTINLLNYSFILLFFPSFVTGIFLPNLICGIFVFFNLFFNFQILKNIFLKYSLPAYCFVFFYFLLLVSSIFSKYSIHSLESSALYFTYLIYCLSLIILFNNKRHFRKLFLICGLLTCLILSLDAFYEIARGSNILGFSSIDGRVAGLFGSRWVLGRYLIYILPVLIGIYFLEKNNFKNLNNLFYITVILTCLAILFSGERAALIMLYIYLSLLLLFFITKLSLVKIFPLLMLLAFLIILPFMFPETSERIRDNFLTYLTSNDYEKNPYLSMFVTSLKMFVENPYIGIGPNNFRYECAEPIYSVSKLSCSTHPHSTTFQLLSEVGIFGFIAVNSVLMYFIYKSFLLLKSKTLSNSTFGMYSLQCSIIIYLFPLMITGNFFLSWYGFIYYLPISLFILYSNKVKLEYH